MVVAGVQPVPAQPGRQLVSSQQEAVDVISGPRALEAPVQLADCVPAAAVLLFHMLLPSSVPAGMSAPACGSAIVRRSMGTARGVLSLNGQILLAEATLLPWPGVALWSWADAHHTPFPLPHQTCTSG